MKSTSGGGVGGVHVDDNRAEPQDREHRDQVLRAIRQHDADTVTVHDAATRQRRREPIGAVLEVAERQVGAEE